MQPADTGNVNDEDRINVPNQQSTMFKSMLELESLFDFALYGTPADGSSADTLQPIRSFKSILAAGSQYFRTLFTNSNFNDPQKNDHTSTNFSHECLKTMVEFLHTGDVRVKRNAFAVDLLRAAQFYLVVDLISACEAHLLSRLKVDNSVDLWKVACQHKLPSTLLAEIEKFLAKNLPKIMIENSFLHLTSQEICNVLSIKPVVRSVSVDICFQSALAWLEYDPKDRRASSKAVLDLISLCPALISRKDLLNACRSKAMSQPAKRKLLDLCARYIEHDVSGQISVPDFVEPSSSSSAPGGGPCSHSIENLYFIGGAVDTYPSTHFHQYNVTRKEWIEFDPLPCKRRFCCAGIFNGDGDRLLVFGGEKEELDEEKDEIDRHSADINEFNLSKSVWSGNSIATLPYASNTWVACGNQQVVFLSNQGDFITYSPQNEECLTKKSMPCERWCHSASYSAALNSVFTADGRAIMDETKYYPRIDKYDIASDTWQSVGFAKIKCIDRASALCGDELYLAGGKSEHEVELDKVEVCNVRTGKVWSIPNLSTPRPFCQAALLYNNVICVFGSVCVKSVDAYDVREGKWTTGAVVPDMPVKIEGFGLAWK